MAYQLPLVFVDVSNEVRVCATRIVAIMSTETYQAREAIKSERKAGTLINAAGRDKALSAVFLDNGAVIASSYSVEQLNKKIVKSQEMRPKKSTYSEEKAIEYNEQTLEEVEEELGV